MSYDLFMRKNIFIIVIMTVLLGACATPYREFDAVKAHSISRAGETAPVAPTTQPITQKTAKPAAQTSNATSNQPTDILPSAIEERPSALKSEALPPPKASARNLGYHATALQTSAQSAENKPVVQPQALISLAPVQLTTINGGAVVVDRQETLFGVSRRSGVSVADLASYNSLELPYTLHPGQRLHWPTLRYHRVVVGETAVAIAHHYGLALAQLTEANGMAPPIVVRVGQVLRLPDKQVAAQPGKPAKAPTIPKNVVNTPNVETNTPPPEQYPVAEPVVTEPVKPAESVVATGPAPRFVWPLPGRILSGFGNKGSGRFNDGINIAATRGEPVKAAADGTVVYANQLRGFGWLVLIRHRDNWVTTYAHNDSVLVAKGTMVHRGETIARAGSTGVVTSPQLHFEIRRGTRAVDPMLQLPEREVSSREGDDRVAG